MHAFTPVLTQTFQTSQSVRDEFRLTAEAVSSFIGEPFSLALSRQPGAETCTRLVHAFKLAFQPRQSNTLARIRDLAYLPPDVLDRWIDQSDRRAMHLADLEPGTVAKPIRNVTLVSTVLFGGVLASNPRKRQIFDSWTHRGVLPGIWPVFTAEMQAATDRLRELADLVDKGGRSAHAA